MDLYLTLGGLVVCFLIGLLGYKQQFRKRETLKAPIIPWIWVMLIALSTGFMLIVHLANIVGFETGRR